MYIWKLLAIFKEYLGEIVVTKDNLEQVKRACEERIYRKTMQKKMLKGILLQRTIDKWNTK